MPLKDIEKRRAYDRERGKTAERKAQKKVANWKSRGINITWEDYERMYHAQKGRCPISGETFALGELVPDHDHETGYVRALICGKCNTALGMLGDRREMVYRLLKYIRATDIDQYEKGIRNLEAERKEALRRSEQAMKNIMAGS